jgi:hypothetical protein
LTISPQLSDWLGSATQSAAASTRGIAAWFRKPHHVVRTPQRAAAARVSAMSGPLPASATTTCGPSRPAAAITSVGRFTGMNFPANNTRKSSSPAPSSRRVSARHWPAPAEAEKRAVSIAWGQSTINGSGTPK